MLNFIFAKAALANLRFKATYLRWLNVVQEKAFQRTQVLSPCKMIKGTVMQTDKALTNDRVRVSKVS